MKEGTLLVNTARAELIDERDLKAELERNRISGAFDVFHREPLLKTDTLRRYENVIMTHSIQDTTHRKQIILICELATKAVEAYFTGKPINVVNS